jgi:peptidoglycan/LPS O-acetylase OafA/YrhL
MRIFFPKLDSLRFLSFFFVYWDHCISLLLSRFFGGDQEPAYERYPVLLTFKNIILFYMDPIKRTGGLGVHMFFVISGFLITYLLIAEFEQTGKIQVRQFYKRRALRIWPLYFFCMIMGALLLPRFFSAFVYCGNIFLGLSFLNNYDVIYYFDRCANPQMVIAWSVAIEEQFYIFWPLLFLLIIKMNSLFRYLSCLALIAGSLIFIYNTQGVFRGYHTFSNMIFLMTGCLGAFYFKNNLSSKVLQAIDNNIFIIVLITVAVQIFKFYYSWILSISYILLPFLYLTIVVYFSLCKKGPANVFDTLGKYTYGMYFYHTMVLTAIFVLFDILQLKYNQNSMIMFWAVILTLPATILVSIISYNVLERPFLLLKKKLAVVQTR